MKRDEWSDDEIIYWLMEIDRRQKLIAVMIAVFGLLWAITKLFPTLAAMLAG